MSQVNTDPRLPQTDDVRTLKQQLVTNHRDIATQINILSEGKLSASFNAAPTAPANGAFVQGDFVRNSIPVELGVPGAKYVVFGFMCIAAPLTFVEMRFLTGN